MTKKFVPFLFAFLLLLAGCSGNESPAAQTALAPEQGLEDLLPEADGADKEPSVGRTAVAPEEDGSFDEAAWETYSRALAQMDELDAREEQFLVHTVQETGGTTAEDSVDVRLRRQGLTGTEPQFTASGRVISGGGQIPLELYFRDGVLYSVSGTAKVKKPAEYEASVATVDILGEFLQQLKKEYVISMGKTENADGTIFLRLSFHGKINQVDTSGSGELILNGQGYIISQKYNLTAQVEQEGKSATVTQTVECTLLSYGASAPALEFPPEDEFLEVGS